MREAIIIIVLLQVIARFAFGNLFNWKYFIITSNEKSSFCRLQHLGIIIELRGFP